MRTAVSRRSSMVLPLRRQQQGSTSSSPHSLTLLGEHYQKLAEYHHQLMNIMAIFCNDEQLYPLQCQAAIDQIAMIRADARYAREFLESLDVQTTKRLQPYGCRANLQMLEYWLSDMVLSLSSYMPICQIIPLDCVDEHLHIRSRLRAILTTYEDGLSQLAALLNRLHSQSRRQGHQQQSRRAIV
jgi:hypothetical protein